MRPALSTLPLALLFLASVVPSYGQKTASARAGAAPSAEERRLAVAPGAPLTVECALRPEQRAEWRLDGGAVPADMRAAEAAPGAALTARLRAAAARAHHAGVYTCAPGSPRVRVSLTGTETASTTPVPDEDPAEDGEVVYFDLYRNFSLNCSSLSTDRSVPLSWEKNGTAIEKLPELSGRVVLLPAAGVERALLALAEHVRAADMDVGNYTCRAADAARRWQLRAKPHAKLPADVNVVEGQKLKITCKLIGRPYPVVEWTFSNVSESMENASRVQDALPGRVYTNQSEQGVPEAQLTVDPAQRSDAGWFQCAAAGGVGTPAVTRLRVKDMYAALWPFLGICAEVFVLCAIILVYEKRRTKPELDDSDTDNHDQKKS